MSSAKDHNQDQPETCLREDGKANASDPPGPEHEQNKVPIKGKHLLQPSLRRKRPVSPLALFKEDFSQLKEEMLKVFKEPVNQAENNLISTTIDLLKEDFNHFKEDVASVFNTSPKPTEKSMNRLSSFKDDLSSIFKLNQSKDRDTAKEDSSETVKVKVTGWNEPVVSRVRRDQTASQKANNSQRLTKTVSVTSKEQKDYGLSRNLSEQTEENINTTMKQQMEEWEEAETDQRATDRSLSEVPQSEGEDLTPQPGNPALQLVEEHKVKTDAEEREQDGEEDEEEKTEEDEEQDVEEGGKAPSEVLSSAIGLISLRDPNIMRDQSAGDLWAVKNFACYLTFDPNTANAELCLSNGNRMATRLWSDLRTSEHPDRFERCPQVLCREGLLDSNYWEVSWSGGADIGVTYNSISRDGDMANCLLGHNKVSWSLECSEESYTPCHNNKRFRSCSPLPFTRTVGVHLDWSAGALSFYCVSQDTMVHLHTFTCSFTEPLYPCFWVWAYDGCVSLCDVALEWERLLH